MVGIIIADRVFNLTLIPDFECADPHEGSYVDTPGPLLAEPTAPPIALLHELPHPITQSLIIFLNRPGCVATYFLEVTYSTGDYYIYQSFPSHPLCCASVLGHLSAVQTLLPEPSLPSADSIARTPLSCASRSGHLQIVKLLRTNHPQDANTLDTLGKTALSQASRFGRTGVVRLLLSHTAAVDSKDGDGSCVHCAQQGGNADYVGILLEYGGDVDAQNTYGKTALS